MTELQDLERRKKALLKKKEVLKMEHEVNQLEKELKEPSKAGKMGKQWVDGARRIGGFLGKNVVKVGENLSNVDVTEKLVGRKK